MELSSSRFKGLAVSSGISFWFFVITTSLRIFSLELFLIFILGIFLITQIFINKLEKILDVFALVNTKLVLGILFVFIISLYGILFKLLKIDLLRIKKQKNTYWLEVEQLKESRIFKQY